MKNLLIFCCCLLWASTTLQAQANDDTLYIFRDRKGIVFDSEIRQQLLSNDQGYSYNTFLVCSVSDNGVLLSDFEGTPAYTLPENAILPDKICYSTINSTTGSSDTADVWIADAPFQVDSIIMQPDYKWSMYITFLDNCAAGFSITWKGSTIDVPNINGNNSVSAVLENYDFFPLGDILLIDHCSGATYHLKRFFSEIYTQNCFSEMWDILTCYIYVPYYGYGSCDVIYWEPTIYDASIDILPASLLQNDDYLIEAAALKAALLSDNADELLWVEMIVIDELPSILYECSDPIFQQAHEVFEWSDSENAYIIHRPTLITASDTIRLYYRAIARVANTQEEKLMSGSFDIVFEENPIPPVFPPFVINFPNVSSTNTIFTGGQWIPQNPLWGDKDDIGGGKAGNNNDADMNFGAAVVVSPNPADAPDGMFLHCLLPEDENAMLCVTAADGRILTHYNIQLRAGYQVVRLQTEQWGSGLYVVQLRGERGTMLTTKVVVR